jgi:nicotinamidase-related amidase
VLAESAGMEGQPMNAQPRKVMVELAVPEPQAVIVDPSLTALVIIDMQNDFAKMEGISCLHPRRSEVIAPIRQLLTQCREAELPVIYVQSIRDPDAPEFRVFGKQHFVMRGSWGAQIVDELAPLPSEPVVEKNSHDPFVYTRLERVLADRGIRPSDWTVIVVGLGLTNCVACAVSGFSVRHYRVLLPMDCTASASREEDLCNYARFLQGGYSYNVTLTATPQITIAARSSSELRRSEPAVVS